MPEEKEITEQLGRVIKSELFCRSGVTVSLLTLLVKATLNGTKLKEATIGTEIFGKSYDPLKNDTKVRVYVHNLRKKLAEYYLQDGKNDPVVFSIEKGQYMVQFIPAKNNDNHYRRQLIFRAVMVVLIIIVTASSLIWWRSSRPERLFWGSFLSRRFPVSVLIGDHFMIEGPIPVEGTGLIRAYNINSEADFAAYIRRHPENASQMAPNRYSYVTKMGPYCTRTIGSYFYSKGIIFNLMLNSEWDKSRIGSENVLYIGQFKTMGFLRNVFAENNKRVRININTIEVTDPNGGAIKTFYSVAGSPTIDYTLVSKIKGPNKNDIMMFLSDNDIGVISLVNYFTNADSLSVFNKGHNIGDKPFTALFKVSGWERTGYKTSLVMIDK